MHVWLLVEVSTLPLFKLSEFLFASPSSDPQLFHPDSKVHTCCVVILLFPFMLVWLIIGTFWYVEVAATDSCFDEQVLWYISLWMIVFYCWAVGYATYISYAASTYFQAIEWQSQFMVLLDQYDGLDAPMLNQEAQGLTPMNISMITHEELSETNGEEILCSICLDVMKTGDMIRHMPCTHKFHMPCIDNWLMRKGSCPNCLRKFN
jgi:hypothetical protein